MGNFYEDVIKKDSRFASTECISDINLLEPGTRIAVQALIADAASQGKPLRVLETYRSQARQEMLYEKHLTELRKVGVHNYGLACDFAYEPEGKYDPKGEDYLFLVALCGKHGLISGVDWGTPHIEHSFRDYDHVQRCPVWRQNALFAGLWYPPPLYDPHVDSVEHGIKGL